MKISKTDISNSREAKAKLQPFGSDENKKKFAEAFGYLPKTNDHERDAWEEKKWGIKHKQV